MKDDTPLLTLAIPTYNRAPLLDQTLEKIVSDPHFSDEVEIVIADNCSTDHTPEIAKKYQTRFPNRILYHRNGSNLMDENFVIAMSLGRGAYIKLMNDTAMVKEGALGYLLTLIRKYQPTQTLFMVCANTLFNKNKVVACDGINGYLKALSYSCTWIGNLGVWRELFNRLPNKTYYVKEQLCQVDIAFKAILQSENTVIHFRKLFDVNKARKGGYNLFKVFVKNYFDLLEQYISKGLKRGSIVKEKFLIYSFFIYPRLVLTLFNSKDFAGFNSEKSFQIVYNYYKYNLYFYFSLLFIPFIPLLRKVYKM